MRLAMVDTALVPEVLGQPEETARRLLDQAGLTTEVQTGCDTDAPAPPPSPAGSGAPGRARGARPPPAAGSACGSTPRGALLPPQRPTGEADAHQHAEREETEVG